MYALHAFPGGICSGGKDGMVKLWSAELEASGAFDQAAKGPIRSVCVSPDASRVLVGTHGALFEISIVDGSELHGGKPLAQGHARGELWGLAVNPKKKEFATVGDDATLRVWSIATCKQLASKELEAGAPVAYSPGGDLIAVGLGAAGKGGAKKGKQGLDGSFVVFQAESLSLAAEGQHAHEWVRDLKFSPDGRTLAPLQDNQVYTYDATENFAQRATVTANKAFVTALDFSIEPPARADERRRARSAFADATAGRRSRSPRRCATPSGRRGRARSAGRRARCTARSARRRARARTRSATRRSAR